MVGGVHTSMSGVPSLGYVVLMRTCGGARFEDAGGEASVAPEWIEAIHDALVGMGAEAALFPSKTLMEEA